MHTDRFAFTDYPYEGTFYVPADYKSKDGDLIGDEDQFEVDNEESIILVTPCDIQETTKGWSAGAITASFNVYFPFDKEEGFPVRRGMMFRCKAFTMPVNGTVSGIVPSLNGGCVAYIKDVNV